MLLFEVIGCQPNLHGHFIKLKLINELCRITRAYKRMLEHSYVKKSHFLLTTGIIQQISKEFRRRIPNRRKIKQPILNEIHQYV